MKRILSFLFMTILSLTIAYGQNSKGGSNFYLTSGLSGRVLPALGAPGGTALVYVDDAFSDDKVVSELTSAGYTVTVASSASDFNTRIAGGGWSLVVLFNQNYYINSSGLSFTAVQNYVNGGGLMIFLSWDSANSESWANLFGAHYTGNNNNNTLTITDPVISNGITNPIILTNPGWLIGFSVGLSALSGSEVLGTFGNGDAAIIRANGGRTIILGYLSDTTPVGIRGTLVGNLIEAIDPQPVPVSMWVMISAFVLIAMAVAFRFRRRIF